MATWEAIGLIEPEFQLANGCLADQLIGQYLADIAGLGPLLSAANIRKTLESIRKYNYRAQLFDHDSVQRVYALNDEPALLVCDYTKSGRPKIPFPYYQEAWTGIEYLVAAQFIQAGMLREGVGTIEDVRRRFDGERRNPWDEPECGHHYARAMSAWSSVIAFTGFDYHGPEKAIASGAEIQGPGVQIVLFDRLRLGIVFHQSQRRRQSNRTCRHRRLVASAIHSARPEGRPDAFSHTRRTQPRAYSGAPNRWRDNRARERSGDTGR